MNSFVIVTLVITIVLFLAAMAISAVWVYKDAQSRGLQAGMWMLLVLLSGNFIGLILYLVLGRKQQSIVVCQHCGSQTVQGRFCSACGGNINGRIEPVNTSKNLLVTSIICIVLAFVFFGLCIGSAFTSDGFHFGYQFSSYQQSGSSYVRKLSDKSSGDKWELSYSEASDGYTFQKIYHAKTKAVSLSVEIQCNSGTVHLFMIQNHTEPDKVVCAEIVGAGSYTYDMSVFSTGNITIKIVNINASNFSSTLQMKT